MGRNARRALRSRTAAAARARSRARTARHRDFAGSARSPRRRARASATAAAAMPADDLDPAGRRDHRRQQRPLVEVARHPAALHQHRLAPAFEAQGRDDEEAGLAAHLPVVEEDGALRDPACRRGDAAEVPAPAPPRHRAPARPRSAAARCRARRARPATRPSARPGRAARSRGAGRARRRRARPPGSPACASGLGRGDGAPGVLTPCRRPGSRRPTPIIDRHDLADRSRLRRHHRRPGHGRRLHDARPRRRAEEWRDDARARGPGRRCRSRCSCSSC